MRTKIPPLTYAVQIVPWTSDIQYLGLLSGSELLCTKNLHVRTVTNKATDVHCNSFPLLARDSTLSQKTKSTPYKLLIQSLLPYAVPVCSFTSDSNYLNQLVHNKSLRVSGNCPTGTLTSRLHDTLNIESIQNFIHQFRDKFFATCPSHPKPLV